MLYDLSGLKFLYHDSLLIELELECDYNVSLLLYILVFLQKAYYIR